MQLRIILLTIFFLTRTSWSINEDLINKFFQVKLCTIGTILNCNTKQETLKLVKNLMKKGLRISTFNMDRNFSTELALAKGDNNLAVIVDGDCLSAETILNQASQYKYFFETYRWLIFSANYDKIMEKIKNIVLEINVDVTVTIPSQEETDDSQSSSNWIIYDVYNPAFRHGGDFKIEKVGSYDINASNNLNSNGIKYYKRRNMTGILFNSVMVVPENISISLEEYLASDQDRVNNTITRAHNVVIENCQTFYNFTNNRSLSHSWGYLLPNGDVDGMLKDLKEKRIDFGNAPLTYRLYRAKLVDFGHGNIMLKSVFVFQHPKNTFSSSEIYLRPLLNSVWFTTFGYVLLLIITLRILITTQNFILNSDTEDHSDWSFLFLYGIGELCQQGYTLVTTFVSGKIVTFTTLLFSFLIYQFYFASIISLLLTEPPRTIKTTLDLLKSSFDIGCEDLLFQKSVLMMSTDPVVQELYRTKIQQANNISNFFVPAVGLRKVQQEQGGFAFYAQTSTIYPIVTNRFSEKVICSLAEIQMQPDEYTYMVIQKRSPFRELFNYCMYHQIQVGILKRLRTYWSASKPVCLNRQNYLEISVGIKESYWGLVILGCGYILAFVLLVFELFWSKKIIKKQNAIEVIN